ncbi:F-box/RNI-like superfamily protein [Striga asiatica]|uniref:F-box/RNI-like superfamily protein n=1 Tax=Striga asiatica TaxID=4170 RepID=A0A5A7PH27_STRAF|nr:F-box/RNI-like superfamily protein [Striga asiatica]
MKCRIPRTLDWELLDSLKISEDVRKYLKALNLDKYEAMDNVACAELVVEFFTTFVPHDNGKFFTCQMKGNEYKVDNNVMHEVFGFRTTGSRKVPGDFEVDKPRAALSPCDKFKVKGPSNGLIKDVAIAVVYKFLCYNVFGKKVSNKVSEQEVYLLWVMCAKKPICMTAFVIETLRGTEVFATRPPRLTNIVTGLAKHFNVQIDEVPLQLKKIVLWDLVKAYLVKNSTTIIDFKHRGSSQPQPHSEDEAEDEETHTNPTDYFLPPAVDTGAADAHWEEHNKRLDTFIEHNDRRWEEHNKRLDECWTQWESRQFDQWKQWGDQFQQWDVRLSSGSSLPYPPPPPPPPASDAHDAP